MFWVSLVSVFNLLKTPKPKYFSLLFMSRASIRKLYQQPARLQYQLWQPMREADAFKPFPIDEA